MKPDTTFRAHVFSALGGMILGPATVVLDLILLARGRASTVCRHCQAQTFTRAQHPYGFWLSHVFLLSAGVSFMVIGVRSARKALQGDKHP